MGVTLAEGKAAARTLLRVGEPAEALAALDHLLAAEPRDDELRLAVAATLTALGRRDPAGDIYRSLCLHLVRAGRPLPAIVAAHALRGLDLPADFLFEAIADMYAAGAPTLAPFAARPAPVNQSLVVDERPSEAPPLDELVERVLARALDLSAHPPHQAEVHPIAFLSELAADALRAVLPALRVRGFEPGEAVVRQGDEGDSLFLLALGQLRVATTIAAASVRELARLHENSLFGEMALVTNQPRGASVIASEAAIVLELEREALEQVRRDLPSSEAALTRFSRERLIRNLLATSPLFTPFTKDQQRDLLRRFEGVELDLGATVIRQGEPGRGLYVVLSGELDVTAQPAGASAPVALARLGPGDVFGEMALVSDRPTSATVTTLAPAALMFLSRVYVERLAEAVPELARYFAALTESRDAHNQERLGPAAAPEVIIDIDDSGLVVL